MKSLYEGCSAVDDRLHNADDGKDYSDVAKSIDTAVETLRRQVPKPELLWPNQKLTVCRPMNDRRNTLLFLILVSVTRLMANDSNYSVTSDIKFAMIDGRSLQLDLYIPKTSAVPPRLIVWIHGGAWRKGSRKSMPLQDLVHRGFAIASIDYRLSPVARFPAQVHDIKAAIRFLRRHGRKWGIDTEKVGIAGSSAGGHLAALVGATNGVEALEGTVGDDNEMSSDVQAVADFYGPTNFHTILKQSTPHGLSVRVPALQLLIGGSPESRSELASLASPVDHIDSHDPPLFICHGDQDPQVPINQSHELHAKYKALNLDVQFEVVHGGHHGGPMFFDQNRNEMLFNFFKRTLR